MKTMVRNINDHGIHYKALAFVCPGCASVGDNRSGLHMLPVNTDLKKPAWTWDGNLEAPTITPSILTGKGTKEICHSFLTNGIFNFLTDSTHELSGQHVPIPDLPDWVTNERE